MSSKAPTDDPLYQNHVAVTFRWPYEADEVYVTGDWNEYKLTADHRLVLEQSAKKESGHAVFKLTLMLLPGVHRYKFYVNNSWEIDPKKPVTLGGMSNLLVVGAVKMDLSRKIAGDVTSEEWDLIGWKLNEAWFMSSVLQVIGNCRSRLKNLKISSDLKSINGKLLGAVLQGQATAEDFCRQLTIAPELYFSCDAGEFVNLLFETMIQQGDKDNLSEFLFTNVHKNYSNACTKCGFAGEMLATTSVFMLNVVPTQSELDAGTRFDQLVLANLAPKEPCPSCGGSEIDVIVSFDLLPRFLLVNTSAYFSVAQLSQQLIIPNAATGERHFYDLIGCNTVTANTYHTAITRIAPNKWTLYADTDRSDLPSWDLAAKRIAWGKASFFVFERTDIRRDKPAPSRASTSTPTASYSPNNSRSELPEI